MVINYTIVGTASGGEWTAQGSVNAEWGSTPSAVGAFDAAMRAAFQQLTDGNATYGNPGKGGCRGPYKIIRVHLEVAT